VGAAITVGYPLAQTLVAEFQGWINAGRDVASHSISHTYYTNTDALDIQYTGSGTAATLSISNKTLTITVTGASDSVSYNLAQGEAQERCWAWRRRGGDGEVYVFVSYTVRRALRNGMCSVYGGGVVVTGSGGRERAGCEECRVSHVVERDAADDG